MLKIGFTLVEVTSLGYFNPLFIELDSRGQDFIIFCDGTKSKPTGIVKNDNIRHLKKWKTKTIWYQDCQDLLSKIKEHHLEYIITAEADPFRGMNFSKSWKLVVIPTLTDYIELFQTYSSLCDIFLSPGPITDNYLKYPKNMKVIQTGNPKYDVLSKLNQENSSKKIVIVFAPNKGDIYKSLFILLTLKFWALKKGIEIVFKTRKKHNSWILRLFFSKIVLDEEYYPSTSMQMISKSLFVVLFDSTTFKECLFLNRPMINVNIKTYRDKRFVLNDFFEKNADGKSIIDIKNNFTSPIQLFKIFEQMLNINSMNLFDNLISSWFSKKENCASFIIDSLEDSDCSDANLSQ